MNIFIRSIAQSSLFHCLAIVILGLAVYSNTLHAPFQWDENQFLIDNPFITEGASVSKLKPDDELYKMVMHRYAGYLTFRLNYRLHGFSVSGYHIFNISMHILNGLLVYWLVRTTFSASCIRNARIFRSRGFITFLTAVLFTIHPIQTEAVTYVHQRPVLIAAFFSLLALAAYAKWKLMQPDEAANVRGGATCLIQSSWYWYLIALLASALAMKSKEHAFTLPLAITAYEYLFFSGNIRKRLLWLLPMLLTMLIIPLTSLLVMDRQWDIATKTHVYLSRSDYLLTEIRVMVTYFRLLALPVRQTLLYDYPLYNTFFAFPVLASFLFLSCIVALSAVLLRRALSGEHPLRLVVFGIIWFFLAISVESSIFPTPYVIQEYRLYLPSAGVFLAAICSLAYFGPRLMQEKIFKKTRFAIFALIIVFALAAHARNAVWNDIIGFWSDVATKSPGQDMPHLKIGNEYFRQKKYMEAIREYETAISIDPKFADSHYALGLAYNKTGRYHDALKEFQIALTEKPDRYEIPFNIGISYVKLNLFEHAIPYFRQALSLNSSIAEVHYALGIALESIQRQGEAVQEYQTALSLKPDHAGASASLQQLDKKQKKP